MIPQKVRIASAAYALPPAVQSVDAILQSESARIDGALAPIGGSRQKVLNGLGVDRVRVCDAVQPYDLVCQAANSAIRDSGLAASDIQLIVDYSTLPGASPYLSFAHKLSADFGIESALNLSLKAGGCGGLHIALKTALGWMTTDEDIRTALLIAGDTPPPGSRSLLPVTVQGDAGSALVLRREGDHGPEILAVEALTLAHLYDAILITSHAGSSEIQVNAARIEKDVMPIYYLNLFRLIEKALSSTAFSLRDVSHFIYSNISRRDREGFRRMLGLPESFAEDSSMAEYGHTFASDLVVNYADLQTEGRVRPGDLVLFASAGIGFTWGATLARA